MHHNPSSVTRYRPHALPLALVFLLSSILLNACSTLPKAKGPRKEVRKMLVTAYDAGQKSTGWKYKYGCLLLPPVYAYGPNEGKRKQVGVTSDGTKARKGTIAADITRYPYGTRMYIPGYGWGEVHDTGSAIKGDHIDIFFPSNKDCMAWGKRYLDVIIERK
ncbi:MAG: 3D domain-containing protein [Syntrophales bacterium]